MFRRMLLSLIFAAAFGVAGASLTSTAQAHGGGCFGSPFGYGGYGLAYGAGYGGYGNAALRFGAYGPFVQPYPVIYNRYPVYYGGHGHGHHHHGHSGVSISIGF
jgi:hypothetical protein